MHTRAFFPRRGTIAWRILLCLTLLAMAWRAALPAGFMPDAAAAREGRLVLTLCTGSGIPATVLLDLNGNADGASTDGAAGADCPFCLLASPGLPPDTDTAIAAYDAPARVLPPAVYRAAPALPALGPPLGSRAPPFHLV